MFQRRLTYFVMMVCLGALAALGASVVFAQETVEYTGTLRDGASDDYPVEVQSGQRLVITAEATGGDLDTVLELHDARGRVVADNDDRGDGTFNSEITYNVRSGGEYTVTISAYPGSSGDYMLIVTTFDEAEIDSSTTSLTNAGLEDVVPARDADEEYTGTVDDGGRDPYPISLRAGQGIIAVAESTDDELDPFLILEDPNGDELVENDDMRLGTLRDSLLAYVAEETGDYTVIMTNFPDYPGSYRLRIWIATPEEVDVASTWLSLRDIVFSGPEETLGSDHFLIHYTTSGDDSSTDSYIRRVSETFEEVYDIEVNQLGWPAPISDGQAGGDGRYDVYVMELIDDPFQGEFGFASPDGPFGDNPATDYVEETAAAGYIAIDDDYRGYPDRLTLMRATSAHEFHHTIQFGYDYDDSLTWFYEASATWMETVVFPDEQDAVGYIEDVYDYPEICLGADGPADSVSGLLMYGSWLFMESLSDAYGQPVVRELWENVSRYDGWEALEVTLRAHGETIGQAVARYHLQNLVRDYDLAPEFNNKTVHLEDVITDSGDWASNSRGVQELAANYFEVDLTSDVYEVGLSEGGTNLELWALGINGDKAEVISLGQRGAINTGNYDRLYVMVFNTDFDDDIFSCQYDFYTLTVESARVTPERSSYAMNAAQFRPLN